MLFYDQENKSSTGEQKLDNLPSIGDVSPFKELLYEKLADVIIECSSHFKASGHNFARPGFFAYHVRSQLADVLSDIADLHDFRVELSTAGFLIYYKKFVIKFYKAYQGTIPPLRDSKAQQLFFSHNSRMFSQLSLPGFGISDNSSSEPVVHLIAYYDVDLGLEDTSVNWSLAWLRMACPLAVVQNSVRYLWDEPVGGPQGEDRGSAGKPITGPQRPDLGYSRIEDDELLSDDELGL
jgi:hypothetical protein